jgi:hypothetical protein
MWPRSPSTRCTTCWSSRCLPRWSTQTRTSPTRSQRAWTTVRAASAESEGDGKGTGDSRGIRCAPSRPGRARQACRGRHGASTHDGALPVARLAGRRAHRGPVRGWPRGRAVWCARAHARVSCASSDTHACVRANRRCRRDAVQARDGADAGAASFAQRSWRAGACCTRHRASGAHARRSQGRARGQRAGAACVAADVDERASAAQRVRGALLLRADECVMRAPARFAPGPLSRPRSGAQRRTARPSRTTTACASCGACSRTRRPR